VKWCPKDQTVLANEQVIDGRCERCGTPVEEKRLTQWFLKITDYADRLLKGLDDLPWREEIKDAQRAWIGRAKARISTSLFLAVKKKSECSQRDRTRFTARRTWCSLPSTPYFAKARRAGALDKDEVEAYIDATKRKTERERSENKEKTGVKLEGVRVVNPATKEEIPVFIADYVLASYGTGAVMASRPTTSVTMNSHKNATTNNPGGDGPLPRCN